MQGVSSCAKQLGGSTAVQAGYVFRLRRGECLRRRISQRSDDQSYVVEQKGSFPSSAAQTLTSSADSTLHSLNVNDVPALNGRGFVTSSLDSTLHSLDVNDLPALHDQGLSLQYSKGALRKKNKNETNRN